VALKTIEFEVLLALSDLEDATHQRVEIEQDQLAM
jgi:hypothetical protein